MAQIKPQQYRQLINTLLLLDAYIPFEPPEPNSGFIVFQSPGSGYYPKGCGPRCAFITKEDDALVPSQEIEKLLMFLKISPDKYLERRSGLSPESANPGKPAPEVTTTTTAVEAQRKK